MALHAWALLSAGHHYLLFEEQYFEVKSSHNKNSDVNCVSLNHNFLNSKVYVSQTHKP